MNHLTGFQRDLLYIINGMGEPHGLAIKEEIEKYYESEIHHGRLYPNLDALVKEELVTKSQKDRRTNEYRITVKGMETIENRDQWKQQYLP